MGFIIAIWNGPFHIGKLSQPASIGDVLLKILETLWRFAIALLSLGMLLGAGLAAWIKVIEPIIFPPAKSKIDILAEYDDGTNYYTIVEPPSSSRTKSLPKKPFRCSLGYPIKVSFYNNSNKPITRVNFSLEANLKESSRNFISAADAMSFDGIIGPRSGWMTCYSAQFEPAVDRAKLRFKASVWSAEYR